MMEDNIGYSSAYRSGNLPPPVISAINSAQRLFDAPKNKHDLYDAMATFDDAIYTALEMKASLIRSSYRGLYLKVGTQRTFEEDGLIRLLSWIEEQLELEQKFYDYGKKLCANGDWIVLKDPFSTTPNVRSLPIKHLTIIEDESQLDGSKNEELDYQVFKRGMYVLNEQNNDIRLIFTPDQVIHMSLDLEGSETYDSKGRLTYEVWGKSPLQALKTITLWKHNTILNDILIRHRIVPRELHGLNFEDIDESMGGPSTLPKNVRKRNVRNMIEGIMKDYEAKIVWREPDQAYIYDKNATEINMLGPKGFSYAEPNEVIEQQNRAIARVFGIPITVFAGSKGGGGGSYASDIVRSSFTMARTPDIARVIKKGMLGYIKEYIEMYFPYYSHLLERVDIRIQLVMDKDLDRLYKVATVMSQMKDSQNRPLFTPEEIRETVGKEPLTEQDYLDMGHNPQPNAMDPGAWLLPQPGPPNISSPGQTTAAFIQSNPQIIPHPKTDASKNQQQWAVTGG